MKKLFAFVLSLVMVLSLCVACGGNQTGTAGNNGGSGEAVALTIGLPTKATVLDYENNAMTNWVEEQTGFSLSFQPYSGGTDVATQIATTVAAQQPLPDILYGINLGDDVAFQYGREGYFVDLTEYLEDREGKSKVFWDRIEAVYTEAEQDEILRRMTDPNNGAIYSIPTLDTSLVDTLDYQMWINTEWLDQLGLPMPNSIDSLYNTLVAFRDNDMNGDGKTTDEIPLYGAQEGGRGADVVNWIVNMYLYFNDVKHFSIDEDGQLQAPFTTNEYREALKFVNKLIKEGLMLNTVFNTKMEEMKSITTPASGKAMCGIFAGHLTLHADYNNPILKQYKALPLWGNAVVNDHAFGNVNFITTDCENPDAAFELMMTLFTEQASFRLRYGEYGVNWTDADEGAMSPYGIPAKIKILRDPLMEQNTCLWSGVTCTLAEYSEGEAAQLAEALSEGEALKAQLHAESRKNYDAAIAEYNPPAEQLCPLLAYTVEEREEGDAQRTACADYYKKTRTDFCTGKLDPNSDSDWQTYLDTLEELGLEEWLEMAQIAYDRR